MINSQGAATGRAPNSHKMIISSFPSNAFLGNGAYTEEWLSLSPEQQHMLMFLFVHPSISPCGIQKLKYRTIANQSGMTDIACKAALASLAHQWPEILVIEDDWFSIPLYPELLHRQLCKNNSYKLMIGNDLERVNSQALLRATIAANTNKELVKAYGTRLRQLQIEEINAKKAAQNDPANILLETEQPISRLGEITNCETTSCSPKYNSNYNSNNPSGLCAHAHTCEGQEVETEQEPEPETAAVHQLPVKAKEAPAQPTTPLACKWENIGDLAGQEKTFNAFKYLYEKSGHNTLADGWEAAAKQRIEYMAAQGEFNLLRAYEGNEQSRWKFLSQMCAKIASWKRMEGTFAPKASSVQAQQNSLQQAQAAKIAAALAAKRATA